MWCSFSTATQVLGVVPINAQGIAEIDRRGLTLGDHIITARYAGDGLDKSVSSSQLLEQVVVAAQTVPLVNATISAVKLARQYVPGDRGGCGCRDHRYR